MAGTTPSENSPQMIKCMAQADSSREASKVKNIMKNNALNKLTHYFRKMDEWKWCFENNLQYPERTVLFRKSHLQVYTILNE